MLALRSRRTGPGSRVGRPVAEVVVVHVEEIRLKSPGCKLLLKRFGIASLSPFSGASSESEHVCPSLKASRGPRRGRWCRGWKVSWVFSRLLTARRVLQMLGASDWSASRSEISP